MNDIASIAATRRSVVAAGHRLLEAGLVARSWGNVSIRLDERRCLITPSGRRYSELTEKEVVVYDLLTGAYEGDLKPSSEAGLHARIYRERSDVHAIIHTHQPEASVLAAAHCALAIADKNQRNLLGPFVRCAPYGLPSTKKLIEATSRALAGGKAVLMANHGAVCVGVDIDDAFAVADALEAACAAHVRERFHQLAPTLAPTDVEAMHLHFLQKWQQREFRGGGLA